MEKKPSFLSENDLKSALEEYKRIKRHLDVETDSIYEIELKMHHDDRGTYAREYMEICPHDYEDMKRCLTAFVDEKILMMENCLADNSLWDIYKEY